MEHDYSSKPSSAYWSLLNQVITGEKTVRLSLLWKCLPYPKNQLVLFLYIDPLENLDTIVRSQDMVILLLLELNKSVVS